MDYRLGMDAFFNEELGTVVDAAGNPINGVVKEFYPYYDDGDHVKEETSYKAGQKDGIAKSYYESGIIETEALYRDGRKEGIAKGYYMSGSIERETPYKAGQEDGVL